jgi:hypothetical protein
MRAVFLLLLIIQLLCSVWFHRRQNKGAFVGGPISWPKALWLYHAIFSWFLVPLVYLATPGLHPVLQLLLVLHCTSWWLRGITELFMIYKFYNWSPRYGISHDVVHGSLLFVGMIATVKLWPESFINWMAFIYLAVTCVMLCFEVSFAALFLNVRGGCDHKIYYAADEPKWRFINWLTKMALFVGLSHSVIQAVLFFLRAE